MKQRNADIAVKIQKEIKNLPWNFSITYKGERTTCLGWEINHPTPIVQIVRFETRTKLHLI